MSDSTTYKTSDSTPYKQESLRFLLNQHMSIVKTIWRKFDGIDKGRPYRYFDLHGGYGRQPNGAPGSPLIFHEVATQHEIPYMAIVFEKDQEAFTNLKQNLYGLDGFRLENSDHHMLIDEYKKPVSRKESNTRKHQYGIAYSDPSNADPSFDVLRSIAGAYPKIDIVINIAATSYKRTSHLEQYSDLKAELMTIKDLWVVRKPLNNQQWTMLLGTSWKSWNAFRGLEKEHFFRFDTDLGQHWFDEICYTKQQRHDNQYENSLFDLGDDVDKKKVNTNHTQNT